jgi:DNA-binding LacI/PurR family transcriptional regulator
MSQPKSKQQSIQQILRRRIADGTNSPGSRFPTHRDLSREFGISPVTLQKATSQLMREGFLEARGRNGTFVSHNPPHLCRYAIAFPGREDGFQYWSDFWSILIRAAAEVARSDGRKQFVSYYEITGHGDVEDYQRLLADVRARRLAGIILLSGPHLLQNSPLLDDCPVPRVFIGGDIWPLKIPSVSPDGGSFFDRAIGHAVALSRRRPVTIGLGAGIENHWQQWSAACRRHGIEPARWQMMGGHLPPDMATRNLTELLMRLPSDQRPDALIVADDHLAEEVAIGLLTSHLPEVELPTVIAHTNFPKLPRAVVPITYLGFDSVQLIRTGVDVLEAQRVGNEPPRSTLLPAVFASELPATSKQGFTTPDISVPAREYESLSHGFSHATSERKI